jgi:hypothetical protein
MSSEQVANFKRFYNKIIKDTNQRTSNPLFVHPDSEIKTLLNTNSFLTSSMTFLNLTTNASELNGKKPINNRFIEQYNQFLDLLVRQRFITQEMADQVRKSTKADGRKKENKEKDQGVDVKVVNTPLGADPEKIFGLTESKAPLAEIKEEPAKPVEQVATASPAVEPEPVKKKRNMKGLIKYANERKKRLEERENKGMESEPKVPRPQLVRQPTPEQFLQQNLDEFVEAGKEKEKEDKEEKEREIKEQPNEERLLAESRVREPEYSSPLTARILNNLGSLTFSALLSLVGNYAVRTNNKDLNIYAMSLSAALGEALFRPISQAGAGLDTILNNIKKLGATPQDIIKESKQEGKQARRPDIRPEDDEPPAPSGRPAGPPQRSVDDIKGERPALPLKPRVRMSDKEMKDMIDEALAKKKPITTSMDEKSVPQRAGEFARDIGSGIMSGVGSIGRGAISTVSNQIYNALNSDRVLRELDPQRYDEQGRGIKYDIKGEPIRYDADGNRINPLLNPREGPILERKVPEGFEDANDYDGSQPSRIRENIARAGRVARDLGLVAGTSAISAGIANTIADARRGEPAVPTTVATGPETKTDIRPTIKEAPIILKNEELNQDQAQNIKEGKDKDEVRRGAGMLKPKFIVPSVNIFNKTEQEQYVDDIEFAMFDFVQDDSGGNDPTGTNPILRDQTLSQGLRYQRAGVTVNSLYGRNLPDNPKNMSQALMNELFLGEPLLPTMKFLFSEEFYPQEFNLSEFEVNNYDVNNELTAIEALSPYANFTNNQLLDQFIDTSILYGVVP